MPEMRPPPPTGAREHIVDDRSWLIRLQSDGPTGPATVMGVRCGTTVARSLWRKAAAPHWHRRRCAGEAQLDEVAGQYLGSGPPFGGGLDGAGTRPRGRPDGGSSRPRPGRGCRHWRKPPRRPAFGGKAGDEVEGAADLEDRTAWRSSALQVDRRAVVLGQPPLELQGCLQKSRPETLGPPLWTSESPDEVTP